MMKKNCRLFHDTNGGSNIKDYGYLKYWVCENKEFAHFFTHFKRNRYVGGQKRKDLYSNLTISYLDPDL